MSVPERYRALLIGVWTYGAESKFDNLLGPPNDLKNMTRAFRDSPTGIFAVESLPNPGVLELRTAVLNFLVGAKNEHLLLYYSGHADIGERSGKLCLSSAQSKRSDLDASGLSFADVQEWARTSAAQSVTIILDCCKAGAEFLKGADADIENFFVDPDEPDKRSNKTVMTVAAVPGHAKARDALKADAMSPFTEELHDAITVSAVPDDRGLVTLSAVMDRLHTVQKERKTPLATIWGGHQGLNPYLAMRPGHLGHLLKEAGLQENTLRRQGGAEVDGTEIRLDVEQVAQLVDYFQENHPGVATVGGAVGRGKTWILCDVRDRLRAVNWHTVDLEPAAEISDADGLLLALKKYALGLRDEADRCLLVIDGIDWSPTWSEFVAKLDELNRIDPESGYGVSVLVSLESTQTDIQRSWEHRPGLSQSSIRDDEAAGIITKLVSPQFSTGYAGWSVERLEAARARLKEVVGLDLWAMVHLGARWYDPDAERHIIQEIWRSRIGDITPAAESALRHVAALGRYNLWCPLALAAAGVDVLVRLGAEYNHALDAVRINSGFLCRAILVRQVRRGGRIGFNFDRFAADRAARPIVENYVQRLLSEAHRQEELATAVRYLRYHRYVFAPLVRALSRPNSEGVTAWEVWAQGWIDLATVNEVLAAVRSELPPRVTAALAERFYEFALDQADYHPPLPTIIATLETIYNFQQDTSSRSLGADETITRLFILAERCLKEERWPAGVRRNLLRAFTRFSLLDQVVSADLGSALLQPMSPPTVDDALLVIDFARRAERVSDRRELRAELATWDSVGEELVRRPAEAGVWPGLPQLAARTILARFIGDEPAAERLVRQLLGEARQARPGELSATLDLCRRRDRTLAGLLAAQLDITHWSATLYRTGVPQDVARLLVAIGKVRPDLAMRSLRLLGDLVDHDLVQSLAARMTATNDAVSASLTLRTAAWIEERCGVLEDGFAQALAAALGRDFLIDNLWDDSRVSVLSHLIEGFAAARSTVLAAAEQNALEVVEQGIRHSNIERAPRLALLLAAPSALGGDFLDRIRNRGIILRPTMLARMTETRDPGALTAFHELGVALFPGIETDFAEWLADSDTYQKHRLFEHIANYGNALNALRAATAVTTTLVLNGEPDPGGRLLASFDQVDELDRSGGDWTNRVLNVPLGDLPEALNLLRKLDTDRAVALVRRRSARLERILVHAPGRSVAPILAAVAAISPEEAARLTESPRVTAAVEEAMHDLADEGDAFEQLAFLHGLIAVENRVLTNLIPDSAAQAFRRLWTAEIGLITHPILAAGFIEIAGARGANAAREMAAVMDASRLRRRLQRHNAADAAGAAALVIVLSDVSASAVAEVVSYDEARWLLLTAPIQTLGSLVEALFSAGLVTPADAAGLVAARFRIGTDRGMLRDYHDFWISMGWTAWTLRRYGQRLNLDEPPNAKSPQGLHPQTTLWGTAWLTHHPWAADAFAGAAEEIRVSGRPLSRPWAASAVLIVEAEHGIRLTDDLINWKHALRAGPLWVRALLNAASPGTPLHDAFTRTWDRLDLMRLELELHWVSRGWRRVALEAAQALSALR
ncbi:hypothetical protein [Microbispora sp. NPDC049125]|uniref:hypothetical protein n=1 Tax=Microbispora sp. NPDC049125 TaxID=3154929 RepID=UPI003466BD30